MSAQTTKMLLRVPTSVYEVLRVAAQNDMRSVHNYVLRVLMAHVETIPTEQPLQAKPAPQGDTKKVLPDFPYET